MTEDDGRFAFLRGKGVTRRQFVGSGAARAVIPRAAAAEAAEADPLIEEAEHLGRAYHNYSTHGIGPGPEEMAGHIAKNHPKLAKYAHHAVKAYNKAQEMNEHFDDFVRGHLKDIGHLD